jgi:hypothetical protein
MWQGRYLFPVSAPVGVVLATGLTSWLPGKNGKGLIALVGCLGSVALAVWVPFGVIEPAYRPLPADAEMAIEARVEVVFGDQFRLLGYSLEQDSLAASVTLYWQAIRRPDFDYSVFVHLVDQDGELVGQQDHAPGASSGRPPTTWAESEVIADEHRISLLRAVQGDLSFLVGVYNWATGERLPVSVDGVLAGDIYQVGAAMVARPHSLATSLGVILLCIEGVLLAALLLRVRPREPLAQVAGVGRENGTRWWRWMLIAFIGVSAAAAVLALAAALRLQPGLSVPIVSLGGTIAASATYLALQGTIGPERREGGQGEHG